MEYEHLEGGPDFDPENELALSEGVLADGDEDEKFEMSPEEATDFLNDGDLKPSVFNRKKTLLFICCGFAAVVLTGVFFSLGRESKTEEDDPLEAARRSERANSEFLAGLHGRALQDQERRERLERAERGRNLPQDAAAQEPPPEHLIPPVMTERPAQQQAQPVQYQRPPPPPPSGGSGGQSAQQQQRPAHYRSSLVPPVAGSLFAHNASQRQERQTQADAGPYQDYLNHLMQRQAAGFGQQAADAPFYDSSGSADAAGGGRFLGADSVWTGAVIPGVLVTGINTDLPGNVLARVTQNVYDSQTGRNLLIPQGTLLVAQYNSSVSYAQTRVQIVWDVLIRPDGFIIEFGGANGVDMAGMAGLPAVADEKLFEYLKAAGIITLFSVANASMTDAAARNTTAEGASNIAQANAALMNQMSEQFVGRALDIAPTLTVENGTLINVMLNRTLYLPPVPRHYPVQKFILE